MFNTRYAEYIQIPTYWYSLGQELVEQDAQHWL